MTESHNGKSDMSQKSGDDEQQNTTPNPSAPKSEDTGEIPKKQNSQCKWFSYRCLTTTSNYILAFTTIGILIVSYYQYDVSKKATTAAEQSTIATNEAVKVSKRAMELSERGLLSVYRIDTDWKKGLILLTLENTGKTPTDGLAMVYREVHELPNNEKRLQNIQRIDFGQTPIKPGVSNFPLQIGMSDATPKRMARLEAGTEITYIMGFICYGDGFHNPEWTRFNFRLEKKWGLWPIYPGQFPEDNPCKKK